MIYGYARVSMDGQSVDAQVCPLLQARCKNMFRETATGAKTDRAQLAEALAQLGWRRNEELRNVLMGRRSQGLF